MLVNWNKIQNILLLSFSFLCLSIIPQRASAAALTVSTCSQLQDMANDLTADYTLLNDINCAGFDPDLDGKGFIPVGSTVTPFEGTFNGGNFTISNLTIARPDEQRVALFGFVNGGTFQNVTITGSIEGQRRVASLIGASDTAFDLTVNNVTSSADITSHGGIAGGIVGQAGGTMTFTDNEYTGNLLNESPDQATSNTGGLIGYADGILNVNSSFVSGNVTASTTDGSVADVGGIAGYTFGAVTIDTSYFSGDFTLRAQDVTNAGGLVGSLNDTLDIDDSYVTGNIDIRSVSVTDSIGGLIGNSSLTTATIDDSYMTGNITIVAGTDISSGVGGIVGHGGNVSLTGVYNTGDITTTSGGYLNYAGGLIADFGGGSITDSYMTGDLTIDAGTTVGVVGGFVGRNSSLIEITDSYNLGDIDIIAGGAVERTSGFVAYNAGSSSIISESYASGDISIETADFIDFIGGIVANQSDTIELTNVFFAGNIFATSTASFVRNVGGIQGGDSEVISINKSYSAGNIVLNAADYVSNVGGLSGAITLAGNSISDSFSATIFDITSVNPTSNIGALIGDNSAPGTLTNNFYDKTLSTLDFCTGVDDPDPAGCTAVEDDEDYFKGNNTNNPLDSWNFTTVWETAYGNFPVLKGIPMPYEEIDEPDPEPEPEPTPEPSRRSGSRHHVEIVNVPTPAARVITTHHTFGSQNCIALSNITFVRDLKLLDIGQDVMKLQCFLNSQGYTVALTGPGSVGNETAFFGSATLSALIRFQKESGIVPAVGYFGPVTRAFIKAKYGDI